MSLKPDVDLLLGFRASHHSMTASRLLLALARDVRALLPSKVPFRAHLASLSVSALEAFVAGDHAHAELKLLQREMEAAAGNHLGASAPQNAAAYMLHDPEDGSVWGVGSSLWAAYASAGYHLTMNEAAGRMAHLRAVACVPSFEAAWKLNGFDMPWYLDLEANAVPGVISPSISIRMPRDAIKGEAA